MHFGNFVWICNGSDVVFEVGKPPCEFGSPTRHAAPTKFDGFDIDGKFLLHLANQGFAFGLSQFNAAAGKA